MWSVTAFLSADLTLFRSYFKFSIIRDFFKENWSAFTREQVIVQLRKCSIKPKYIFSSIKTKNISCLIMQQDEKMACGVSWKN